MLLPPYHLLSPAAELSGEGGREGKRPTAASVSHPDQLVSSELLVMPSSSRSPCWATSSELTVRVAQPKWGWACPVPGFATVIRELSTASDHNLWQGIADNGGTKSSRIPCSLLLSSYGGDLFAARSCALGHALQITRKPTFT